MSEHLMIAKTELDDDGLTWEQVREMGLDPATPDLGLADSEEA